MRRSTLDDIVGVGAALAVGLGLVSAWLVALDRGALAAQAPASEVYHVAPSCAGVPNCYTTVQAAVDEADDGDVIKVAAGTYTELHPRLVDYRTITQVVHVDRSVTIRGGYTVTDWDVPDALANPTVLDARGQGRVLYVADVPRLGESISPLIEGLIVTGGDATGLGGGPLGEDSGGGIYVDADMVTIRGSQVFSNAAQYGGGVYIGMGTAALNGVTVTSNTAEYGGGLFLSNDAVTVDNSVLASNAASYGGGLFLSSRVATLRRNVVSTNTATASGGGMLLLRMADAVLDGNRILDNSAGSGGGLYVEKTDPTLSNNIVAHNQAGAAGSGLYVLDASPRLLHTTLVRSEGGDGSGVHIAGGVSGFSVVALTNTVLVGHTVGVTVSAGNTVTLESTLWGAGAWANAVDWDGAGTVVTGTPAGNIWGDPDFVNPNAGDYHVGLASAALDRGVSAGIMVDVDGEPRPQGKGCELGADETGLVVTKRASLGLVRPGERLSYTLCVTNTTPVALTAVITDDLPHYVTPAGPLTWSAIAIEPGDAWVRTVPVTVEIGYTGFLTNALWVTTDKGPEGAYTEISLAGYAVYLPFVLRGR